MSAPRRAPAVLAAAVLGLVTACSAGVTGSGSAVPTTAASVPSDAPTTGSAATSTPPVGAGPLGTLPTAGGSPDGDQNLPANFPLPPGVTVSNVVRDGGQIAGTLAVPDAEQAYDYWRSALPTAGYTVTESQLIATVGEIRFRGHGCVGNSQIAVMAPNTTVECDLS